MSLNKEEAEVLMLMQEKLKQMFNAVCDETTPVKSESAYKNRERLLQHGEKAAAIARAYVEVTEALHK